MSGERSFESEYIRVRYRRLACMLLILILSIAIGIYSFGVGSKVINFDIAMDVVRNRLNGFIPDREIDGYWPWLYDVLVFEGTMPRAVGGILIGAILGISGAVMQVCVRNPLASPYTTGISSAAMFGVCIYLVYGISVFRGVSDYVALITNGFIFSMVPCVIMLLISFRAKTTPTMLVLIGIGVMYLFNAFTTIMKYGAEPDVLRQIQMWSIGSIAGVTWDGIGFLIGALMVLIATMMIISGKLDVISSGDNLSRSLGVNPARTRLFCMVVVSACTSVAVCFAGSIGFIGLVIPHVSRMIVGSKTSMLLPCSAVTGAMLLLGADIISRMLSVGLPVGAVTAVIGAPVFLYFLIRMKSNGWGR